MAFYRFQKAGEALSVKYSVLDWKNRLLFAAAKDFPLREKWWEKWLQREADPHLHPVLSVRMLGALLQFFLNAFIA
jgi:hypothetical protein